MKARRIKISIEGAEGGKYTIIAEGNYDHGAVMELLSRIQQATPEAGGVSPGLSVLRGDTLQARIARLIEERFNLGLFSSSDLKEAFEEKYQRPLSLSAAATYLSRLASKGLLERQRSGPMWLYRVSRHNPIIPVGK